MSERVTMPALGESVTEGTVTRWLKSVGEQVQADEPLLEVSTDKVDTEVPSPVSGTLQEILVQEDETVPVGFDLCVIGDGAAPSAAPEAPTEEPQAEQAPAAETAPEAPSTEAPITEDTSEPEAGGTPPSGGGEVSGGEKVLMPALGESVTEGTVTRWLKSEGEDVAIDEPLLEVSTDKVDTEIPSPAAGTLTKILVGEDETVPVGAELAIIGGEASGGQAAAEQAPAPAPQADAPTPPPTPQAPAAPSEVTPAQAEDAPAATESLAAAAPEPEAEPETPSTPGPRPTVSEEDPYELVQDASSYVTPLVRKLAADNGVDLNEITGTGVGGRIRKQDVLDAAKKAEEAAAPAPAPAAAPAAAAPQSAASAPVASADAEAKRGTTEKMSRLRKVIAQRMVESLQVSAQLTAVVEVDMSRIAALRAKVKGEFVKREGVGLSFLPFISLSTVEALKAFPGLNASVDGDSIVYHGGVHLGIAVDTERGLLVPVIKDAGDLNVAGIAKKTADLAERTRTNKVTPDELGGGTFTITNYGSAGTLSDTPIINQPQVAILGTGAIVKRPVVVTDEYGADSIAVRSMMLLSLTYDHRVVDGADAGRFLSALKARLEEGAFDV